VLGVVHPCYNWITNRIIHLRVHELPFLKLGGLELGRNKPAASADRWERYE
jgi:hypothetical protein